MLNQKISVGLIAVTAEYGNKGKPCIVFQLSLGNQRSPTIEKPVLIDSMVAPRADAELTSEQEVNATRTWNEYGVTPSRADSTVCSLEIHFENRASS